LPVLVEVELQAVQFLQFRADQLDEIPHPERHYFRLRQVVGSLNGPPKPLFESGTHLMSKAVPAIPLPPSPRGEVGMNFFFFRPMPGFRTPSETNTRLFYIRFVCSF